MLILLSCHIDLMILGRNWLTKYFQPNNGFPNYIVDEQIKHIIKNVTQENKHYNTPPINKHSSNFFTATKYTTIIN